jgi:P-type Mg2+ transporter
MIGTPGIRRRSSASPPDVAWAAAQGTTDVLAALGSDIDGLSSSEAARRLANLRTERGAYASRSVRFWAVRGRQLRSPPLLLLLITASLLFFSVSDPMR